MTDPILTFLLDVCMAASLLSVGCWLLDRFLSRRRKGA